MNAKEKSQHDKIVQLVERLVEAKSDWAASDDDREKRRLDQFCADLDLEIDRLVYKLYDLTDDEIDIVEAQA